MKLLVRCDVCGEDGFIEFPRPAPIEKLSTPTGFVAYIGERGVALTWIEHECRLPSEMEREADHGLFASNVG